jgi:hypothetical protein
MPWVNSKFSRGDLLADSFGFCFIDIFNVLRDTILVEYLGTLEYVYSHFQRSHDPWMEY